MSIILIQKYKNIKGVFKTPFYFCTFCDKLSVLKFKGDNVDSVFDRIYNVVSQIPKGKVATYGQVASLAGNPRWARVVGYALHNNPDGDKYPCYKVVNSSGKLSPGYAFGGIEAQKGRLEADGITVENNKVSLKIHGI